MENIDTLKRCGTVRDATQSLKLVSGSLVLVLSASLMPRPAAASLLVDLEILRRMLQVYLS